MIITIILSFFAIVALVDLIFLFIQIAGKGAPAIVEWICYPFFGFIPLPLIVSLLFRILEGFAVGLFIERLIQLIT